MKNVTIRLAAGEPITLKVPSHGVQTLLDALRETWCGEARNSLTLSGPSGTFYAINPAHVVMVEVR